MQLTGRFGEEHLMQDLGLVAPLHNYYLLLHRLMGGTLTGLKKACSTAPKNLYASFKNLTALNFNPYEICSGDFGLTSLENLNGNVAWDNSNENQ